MRLFPMLVCVLLTTGLVLAQEDGLVFYADFDGGLDADVAAGDGAATIRQVIPNETERPVLDEIEITDGVTGQAVVTEMAYVEYPGGESINASAGTVEMWVKPLDWTGDDEVFHVFFTTSKEPGWLILYKYFKTEKDTGISRKTALFVQGDPGEERLRKVSVPYVQTDWQPGIWHHIAGTWEKGRARLFIDGKAADLARPILQELIEALEQPVQTWEPKLMAAAAGALISCNRVLEKQLGKESREELREEAERMMNLLARIDPGAAFLVRRQK